MKHFKLKILASYAILITSLFMTGCGDKQNANLSDVTPTPQTNTTPPQVENNNNQQNTVTPIVKPQPWIVPGNYFSCITDGSDMLSKCTADSKYFYDDPSNNSTLQTFNITYFFGCLGTNAAIAIVDGDGNEHCADLKQKQDGNSSCETFKAHGPLKFFATNQDHMNEIRFFKLDACVLNVISTGLKEGN